jgi:hypothetical protein
VARHKLKKLYPDWKSVKEKTDRQAA